MSTFEESSPPAGPEIQQAFKALVQALTDGGIRYAIIGGLAYIQHGRMRSTEDVDALLTVPQLAMPGLFDTLRRHGFSFEFPKAILELRDAGFTSIRFAHILVDLLTPIIPAYSRVLDHAIEREIFGQSVRISSAESLIVMKLISMRPQDESDIRELLMAYGDQLDLYYINTEIDSFAAPDDPRRIKWAKWLTESSESNA